VNYIAGGTSCGLSSSRVWPCLFLTFPIPPALKESPDQGQKSTTSHHLGGRFRREQGAFTSRGCRPASALRAFIGSGSEATVEGQMKGVAPRRAQVRPHRGRLCANW